MITFDKNPNLLPIGDKLKDLIHTNPYNIHILPKNKKNPIMAIGIDGAIFPVAAWEVYNLMQFLANNDISHRICTVDFLKYYDDPLTIHISLREDLSKHINLSVALLKTAINVMERRIKFGDKEIGTVIPNLPKFN